MDTQYRPHAYVCGRACVTRVGEMGTVNFTWLYQHRPQDCRYAVAGTWSMTGEQVHVFDLYNVMKRPDGRLITPPPVSEHVDIDAAIMATAMLYEESN